MEKILTLPEVLEQVRVSYPILTRWMTAGTFPNPLNGRGRKLIWAESQLTEWTNRQSLPVHAPHVTSPVQKDKERQQRLKAARVALERHRKQK